jgi:polysaccharide deacetylase family protein (PEP-CTERM system associated)
LLNKFTVDVEDWFHGLVPDPGRWSLFDRRCSVGTNALLRLLEPSGKKGTFFVLGDVAQHEPELVRAIAAAGHEVGSHGMLHDRVTTLGPDAFWRDLRHSLDVIEQITGAKVASYRAPFFSVDPQLSWFFEILAEEGICHDSSIFPARAPHYGSPGASHESYDVLPGLREWPISVASFGSWSLPFAGGGWFRMMPYRLFSLFRARHARRGVPFIFYIHPYDLDPEQPVLSGVSRGMRFRRRLSSSRTKEKLRRLIAELDFEPIATINRGWTGSRRAEHL